MGASITKIAAIAIAGVIAATTVGAATPARADGWGYHHGGWGHGGGWGHHGGGWGHGGGYGRPGWGYGGYGHHGSGWGAPVAAGVLGALAVGAVAAAASQPYYGGGYGYGGCYPANQPVVDGWGNVVAYRRVQVCN
ncbi:hypothetical protein IY145_05325 [Methylosinus sp. H3A]|uniref:hypothetical protein n=1 Tax=Methylosinus sp. H3A TaxID=2785786 RepID=UPI0018C2ADA2|nr:hypothetical protein [Methylosinus sp. H3A]MBG0808789.1 hypothetical protein [Methylosinus sp. H3A]